MRDNTTPFASMGALPVEMLNDNNIIPSFSYDAESQLNRIDESGQMVVEYLRRSCSLMGSTTYKTAVEKEQDRPDISPQSCHLISTSYLTKSTGEGDQPDPDRPLDVRAKREGVPYCAASTILTEVSKEQDRPD